MKKFTIIVGVKPNNPLEIEDARQLKAQLKPMADDEIDTYEILDVKEGIPQEHGHCPECGSVVGMNFKGDQFYCFNCHRGGLVVDKEIADIIRHNREKMRR